MKYLILIAVVVVVGWLTLARRNRLPKRGKGADASADAGADAGQSKTSNTKTNSSKTRDTKGSPQTMLSCIHCGLHLPQADAVFDGQGRVFCGAAHRLAGPR
jgi:uncharacterized protein